MSDPIVMVSPLPEGNAMSSARRMIVSICVDSDGLAATTQLSQQVIGVAADPDIDLDGAIFEYLAS